MMYQDIALMKRCFRKIKKFKVAKVIHHMKGNPQNMQNNPKYKNIPSGYI